MILLGLSHAEMFNARRIVALRTAKGDGASAEIAPRKSRHGTYGAVGSLVVVVLGRVLVAYGTG